MLLLAAGLLFTGAFTLAACDQEEGERCERDQDCAADLTCKVTNRGEGVCRPAGYTEPVPVPDASVAETAVDSPAAEVPPAEVPAAEVAPDAAVEVIPEVGVESAPAADVRLDVASDATGG